MNQLFCVSEVALFLCEYGGGEGEERGRGGEEGRGAGKGRKDEGNSFSEFTKVKEVSFVCSLISSLLESTLLDTEIISSFGKISETRAKYR